MSSGVDISCLLGHGQHCEASLREPIEPGLDSKLTELTDNEPGTRRHNFMALCDTEHLPRTQGTGRNLGFR
jgi:hypothetical protein